MRSLKELVDNSESTWLLIQEWISKSIKNVKYCQPKKEYAGKILEELQVTTKSILGSIIYYYGEIIIDYGWLRILGSGSANFKRNISTWNKLDSVSGKSTKFPGALLVADDVLGGIYAMNGNAFEGEPGNIYYLAPETLEWESLNMQYSSFLNWALLGDTDLFYKSLRWNNWENEVKTVKADDVFLFHPLLWEGEIGLKLRKKSVIPIERMWNIMQENFKLKKN
jgi:hypothetical protein